MQLSWNIAWRYLFGRKSTNAIQIITGISVLGLAFGTAAIIIILSVFNGFEIVLLQMYGRFNPDIHISATEGKSFHQDSILYSKLSSMPGVRQVSKTYEELALFELGDAQEVGTLKGVDEHYLEVTGLDSMTTRGQFITEDKDIKYGVFGQGMAYKLGLNVYDRLATLTVFVLNNKHSGPLNKPFTKTTLYPGGTFAIQHEIDYEYVLADIKLVQRLSGQNNQISAYEVRIDDTADLRSLKTAVEQLFGSDYLVRDRHEQQETTIKVMRLEKWLSFAILILVLVLVAFNLIGAVWMIILEKKKDLTLLKAIGTRTSMIKTIIIKLSALICILGFSLGILLALLFYFLQKTFGIIKMGEMALIDSYPMELYWSDIPVVALVVFAIGLLAVLIPVRQMDLPSFTTARLS